MKKTLVLEGGGMRAMFTSGVIDVMMENGIDYDTIVGVSAGALFGCNYKSRQPGRALRYNLRFRNEKKYMSFHSLITTGDYVGVDFSYGTMPRELDVFDFKTFRENPTEFYAVCTDIVSGKTMYKLVEDAETDGLQWLRASASMPVFARPVELYGNFYLDGGITDSIPLKFAEEKGADKIVVVLTQPRGYRKKASHAIGIIRMFLRKYPKVADLMAVRHEMYNSQIDYLEQQADSKRVFAIFPDQSLNIGRVEQKEEKLKATYEAGRRKALEILPALKQFLAE